MEVTRREEEGGERRDTADIFSNGTNGRRGNATWRWAETSGDGEAGWNGLLRVEIMGTMRVSVSCFLSSGSLPRIRALGPPSLFILIVSTRYNIIPRDFSYQG